MGNWYKVGIRKDQIRAGVRDATALVNESKKNNEKQVKEEYVHHMNPTALTTLNQLRFLIYIYIYMCSMRGNSCCCSNLALIKLADGARQ